MDYDHEFDDAYEPMDAETFEDEEAHDSYLASSSDLEARQFTKTDVLALWIKRTWIPSRAAQQPRTVLCDQSVINERVLSRYDADFELPDGYRFQSAEPYACPVIVEYSNIDNDAHAMSQSGAFVYRFSKEGGEIVEVLVLSVYFFDQTLNNQTLVLACTPKAFAAVWKAYEGECRRILYSFHPQQHVHIIGGRSTSFIPTVAWDDVILPPKLKDDLLNDVASFFDKGVAVYRNLGLKPFRKLLLAGVPGTGKTMLCSALAKWMLDRDGLVIYISSADQQGPTFNKIEQALNIAAHSRYPTMIILEELDAYLHKVEKALVLNVLDGAESAMNEHGTLLISTTNYPEAIDERVLKRPGRLDRIFIIPPAHSEEHAEQMLRQYLGEQWKEEFAAVVPSLLGYPGAFIREVAIYALTQFACSEYDALPLSLLEESLNTLKAQIDARDDFLIEQKRTRIQFGPQPQPNNNRR